ncbi:flagellar hook protein FlgE [Brevundimonas sp. Bb-A]|jgi:flagellar hook protein FlgE|uniref:flagellar hook protein FlgE n=2 Tax=Caulobacteraceae TaxID=76892 RepID=UPI0012A970BE|nr:flagellar hook protein FlgE [Brevundimonas sp. Bb-A]MED5536597.1 flagellar hook protein FlgE [Pseudomonadota bacterium]QFU31538.1 Flagellar hook protein FlgE [Brevundimonas sp. Bb-A]
MSLNSAMLAGVSGLAANSAALAAISQNIANVNTVGYKRSQGEFQTLVNSQTRTGGSYSAGGVMSATRSFVSQEGQLQRTTENTDLAVSGQGFFVTTTQAENVGATDTRLFTRAGAFRVDNLGYLKNSAGLYLQGWPVDSNGDISTDPSDLSRLRSINIGQVGGTAEPTTRVQINANLRSTQTVSTAAAANRYNGVDDAATPPVEHDVDVSYVRTGANTYQVTIKTGITKITGTATYAAGALTGFTPTAGSNGSATATATALTITPTSGTPPVAGTPFAINFADIGMSTDGVAKTKYDPSANSMAMYNAEDDNPVGVKPDFKMNIPVSDSKGGQRNLEIRFLKSAEPNQWYAEVVAVPASDVVTGAPYSHGQIKTGLIAFTPSGRLDIETMQAWPAGKGLFDDPEQASLNFLESDPNNTIDPADPSDNGKVKWADGLGIAAQTVTLDLNTSAGGLSQLNTASVVQSTVTNGTAFGNLSEITIDEGGFVTAIFDNGVMRRIAQVAIATFPSPDSLKEVSGNAYAVSLESGTYNLKAAGTGGAGKVAAQQLESSTVDLSAEFTGLITTQRAYSASSKIITTADEMLAELINIKR